MPLADAICSNGMTNQPIRFDVSDYPGPVPAVTASATASSQREYSRVRKYSKLITLPYLPNMNNVTTTIANNNVDFKFEELDEMISDMAVNMENLIDNLITVRK